MKSILFLSIVLATNAFDPAKFALSGTGNRFEPANAVELLTTYNNVRAIIPCAALCYRNSLCRTFDFDSNSNECRLFEGSVDTGNLLPNFSSSVVGWIHLTPSLFDLYNASNDQCTDNRFLDSQTASSRCECPIHTFWKTSMCINQRYVNDSCVNNDWCRTDLWLNCTLLKCVGKTLII
jgi:hypothetical protein